MQKILGLIAVIASIIGLVAGFSGAALAEVKQPPGSRISMDVPESFEISKQFSGFIMPAGGVSMVISELPGARLDRLKASMTDAAWRQRGVTNIKRQKLQRTDDHLYLTGRQVSRGREYLKHILLIADPRGVAVITVNVPPASITAGHVKTAAIVDALASAQFTDKAAPIIKQFSLSKLGPFREAGKLTGSAILYTTDGKMQPATPGRSRSAIIIAPSLDRAPVGDTAAFSERALRSFSNGKFKDLKIVDTSATVVGGLKATRLAARAVDPKDGTTVELRQLVLARAGGGYFRLLAIISAQESDKLLAPAEALMASFKPK